MDPKCQEAFDSLKEYLTTPPVLSRPITKEPLYLYLAVAEGAVSSCLIRKESGKQLLVYYVSHVMHDAETRYTVIEKVAVTPPNPIPGIQVVTSPIIT